MKDTIDSTVWGMPDFALIEDLPDPSSEGLFVAEQLDNAEIALLQGDTGLASSYLDVVRAVLGM